MTLAQKSPAERFWSKVDKAGECWDWTGDKDEDGYGRFRYHRMTGAHRFSYLLEHGEIPSGLWVLHRCDNPSCVRPSHLFLGTNDDNMRDMVKKGRGNRGEQNQGAKLTAKQVMAIRADKRPTQEISKAFGVSTVQVSNIKGGRNWRHLLAETGEGGRG